MLDKIKKKILHRYPIDVGFLSIIIFIVSFFISFNIYIKNILSLDDKYKEFIIGDTIYSNYSKIMDQKIIFIFIFIFILLYWLSSKFFYIVYWKNISIKEKKYQFILLIGLPFLQYFLNPLVEKFNLNYLYSYITYSYLIFIWIYKEKYQYFIRGINIFLFSCLSSEVLKYFFINYLNYDIGIKNIFIILVLLSFILFKNVGIYISQIFLPLYFFRLSENSYMYRQEVFSLGKIKNIKILVITLILFSIVYSVYEIRKKKSTILLSTLLTIAFIFWWMNIPIYYITDEYHFGELFTTYNQIYEKGSKLYTEYISVKGFFHIFIGWINEIFYGGYMGIQKAVVLTEYFHKVFLIFIMSFFLSKELLLLFIFLNILPLNVNYFLIIPIMVFLFQDKILNKSWNFIVSYLFLSYIYFMYYQSFGIALAICLLPYFLYSIYKIIKYRYKPSKKNLIWISIGILLFLYNLKTLLYALKYSLINANSNLYYWGNSSGYIAGNEIHFFINMITKNIWVGVSIFLTIYLFKNYKIISLKEKIIYFIIITYPIVINSYLLGRHDGILARTFQYSIALFQFLLILSCYLFDNLKKTTLMLILIIGFLISYNLDKRTMYNFNNLKISSEKIVHVIPNEFERGRNSNLPRLGDGFLTKNTLDDLEKEYNLIQDVTLGKKNSSFLIIDGYVTQSARYSIFDKKIPTMSHSILNIPSLKSQEIELERFNKFDVPIIRISSGVNRYILFYKEIFQKDYIYTLYNNREYLIEKKSFEKIKNKYNLFELEYPGYLYQKEFGVLPIKWGNGYNENKEKLKFSKIKFNEIGVNDLELKKPKVYKVTNISDPFIVYNLSQEINGNEIDFIKLKLKTTFNNNFRMQIFWTNDKEGFSEKRSVFLSARNGELIIPIVKNLDWLKDKNITKIRVDFIELPIDTEVEIEEIQVFKYYKSN